MSAPDRWQVETPGQVALSLPLAGVGARGLAALLDLLAVFLCWILGLFIYSLWGDLLGRWQGLSWAGQLLLVVAVLAAGWGWDVAWEVGPDTAARVLAGFHENEDEFLREILSAEITYARTKKFWD